MRYKYAKNSTIGYLIDDLWHHFYNYNVCSINVKPKRCYLITTANNHHVLPY